MSIPPQLIRVKRKRVDESPVTFLQFDQGVKRHRSGSNWVYQRRHVGPPSQSGTATSRPHHDINPVIHVSKPEDEPERAKRGPAAPAASQPSAGKNAGEPKQSDPTRLDAPRRFHISRKMMMPATPPRLSVGGVLKKVRYGPAVFVERSRSRIAPSSSRAAIEPSQPLADGSVNKHDDAQAAVLDKPTEEPRFKKPMAKSRAQSPPKDAPTHAPLPPSIMRPHNEDMARITADMNDWVLREIGANLHSMEQEKQAEKARFKPRAPTKRYSERHPGADDIAPREAEAPEAAMTDVSDAEDDDDWVIEEYVRIPAHAMNVDVAPTDVGVLVLDGEEDSNLFFGPEHDEEDDLDEDDEDENAENYYTADYPEDEVESDDEYGRHPYGYRNGNASDDEEFDNELDDDIDDMAIEGDDDDATMARIRAYVRKTGAFQ